MKIQINKIKIENAGVKNSGIFFVMKCFKNAYLLIIVFMKRDLETIENVRTKLESLKGHMIKFQVNKGRKKYVSFNGKVTAIYPSVFTILPDVENEKERSYSYTEVLCGNVKFNSKPI